MTKIIKLKTGSPFEDQASYSRLVVVWTTGSMSPIPQAATRKPS